MDRTTINYEMKRPDRGPVLPDWSKSDREEF